MYVVIKVTLSPSFQRSVDGHVTFVMHQWSWCSSYVKDIIENKERRKFIYFTKKHKIMHIKKNKLKHSNKKNNIKNKYEGRRYVLCGVKLVPVSA